MSGAQNFLPNVELEHQELIAETPHLLEFMQTLLSNFIKLLSQLAKSNNPIINVLGNTISNIILAENISSIASVYNALCATFGMENIIRLISVTAFSLSLFFSSGMAASFSKNAESNLQLINDKKFTAFLKYSLTARVNGMADILSLFSFFYDIACELIARGIGDEDKNIPNSPVVIGGMAILCGLLFGLSAYIHFAKDRKIELPSKNSFRAVVFSTGFPEIAKSIAGGFVGATIIGCIQRFWQFTVPNSITQNKFDQEATIFSNAAAIAGTFFGMLYLSVLISAKYYYSKQSAHNAKQNFDNFIKKWNMVDSLINFFANVIYTAGTAKESIVYGCKLAKYLVYAKAMCIPAFLTVETAKECVKKHEVNPEEIAILPLSNENIDHAGSSTYCSFFSKRGNAPVSTNNNTWSNFFKEKYNSFVNTCFTDAVQRIQQHVIHYTYD